jgi:N6-adenosine-specific RNA methylase IME4/ParB-like chromosome segregation protein Spo0J
MAKSILSAPYQILPPLDADAFESLKADILERGVLVPIERDDRGALLDGHHRVRALQELRSAGHPIAEPPVLIRAGLTEAEKRAHVRSLNLHRRHLSAAQRRQVIAAQLADTPDDSDRVIARRLAVSHTTVATVRRRLGVLSGQLGQLRARRGADGKMRRLPMSRSMMAISENQARSVIKALKSVPLEALASVSTADDIQIASGIVRREANRALRLERLRVPKPLTPCRKYGVLYADPPWRYGGASDPTRTAENHYETMDTPAICALPVDGIAGANSVLFLWATPPKLAEAIEVIEAWGFSYVTGAVWDKRRIGLGSWFRLQHEHLLIATRGDVPAPAPRLRVPSIIRAARGQHSAKPQAVRDLIAKQFSGVPKIELFARESADGWDAWGNES